MTSGQLIQAAEIAISSFSKDAYIETALAEMVSIAQELLPQAYKIVSLQGNPAVAHNEHVRNSVQSAITRLKQLKIADVFSETWRLQASLEQFLSPMSLYTTEWLEPMARAISDFKVAYEEFVREYSFPSTLGLLEKARTLHLLIASLRVTLELIRQNLENQPFVMREGEGRLTIYFESHSSIQALSTKLLAFDRIYDKLCEVMTVSKSDWPIRIGKIETGTLFTDFFGAKPILEAMASIITGTAKYIHRTYTRDGKIGAIPKKLELVESLLMTAQKFEAAGLDASQIRESVQIAATQISQEAVNLLANEPMVIVNSEVIAAGNAIQEKLLKARSPLLLLDETQKAQGEEGPPP